MKFLRVLALLFLAGLGSCVGGGGPVSPVIMQPSASLDDLLNAYRTERGLSTLRSDPRLERAAAGHAQDLAARGQLSHRGSDGSDHVRRAERAGYGRYVAENVAAGQKTPAEVMQAWLGSRRHRANIEVDPATHYGFAHAVAPATKYKNFWVLMVGRPPPEKPIPVKPAAAVRGGSMLNFQIGAPSSTQPR